MGSRILRLRWIAPRSGLKSTVRSGAGEGTQILQRFSMGASVGSWIDSESPPLSIRLHADLCSCQPPRTPKPRDLTKVRHTRPLPLQSAIPGLQVSPPSRLYAYRPSQQVPRQHPWRLIQPTLFSELLCFSSLVTHLFAFNLFQYLLNLPSVATSHGPLVVFF